MQGVTGQRDNRQPHPNELGLALLPMRNLLALEGMLRTLRLRLAVALEIGSFFSPSWLLMLWLAGVSDLHLD